MGEHQAESAEETIEYIKKQEGVYNKWLTGSAAKKIKKAL